MDAPADATLDAVIERALVAYGSLAEVGEAIDDEWSYIQDLTDAWRERLVGVSAARRGERVSPEVALAVASAIDEIGRIEDPHRAIDWLSTFPQVTLTAIGERP